ncbi:MAG: winged helix-turn-helix domain-containing protein, partial [Myxococcota bacterium]
MSERYEFGDVLVDTIRGEVRVGGRTVALQPLPWRLLLLLVRHPGRLLTGAELLTQLWPETTVNDEALTQVASRLRRALDGRGLVTVPRRGYRLDAEVRRLVTPVHPPPDRFVGREALLAELDDRLERGQRAITLLGPAGVGKTRAVLEWAQSVANAVFCDLSMAHTGEDVLRRVAVTIEGAALGEPTVERVAEGLAEVGDRLLILDNVEQVVEPTARYLTRWLVHCPEVRFVATSRVVLGVPSERVVTLAPLAVDQARALLTDRADRHPDAPGLGGLLDALDGLPLAIELAASRLRVLDPAALAQTLHGSLAVLREVRPRADRPARHYSLQAALDSSWSRLADVERTALCRLVSWIRPLTVPDLEAMLADRALDIVQGLVDQSLLQGRGDGSFTMLPTLRSFVREVGDPEAIADGEVRHGRIVAERGSYRRVRDNLGHPSSLDAQAVAPWLDDAIVACERAVARGDGATAVGAIWLAQPLLGQGRRPARLLALVDAALPLVTGVPEARLHRMRGGLLSRMGRAHEAVEAMERSIEAANRAGDTLEVARGEVGWVAASSEIGRLDEIEVRLDSAMAVLKGVDPVAEHDGWHWRLHIARKQGVPFPEIAAHLSAARLASERAGRLRGVWRTALEETLIYDVYGRMRQCRASARRALRLAEELGDSRVVLLARYNLAGVAIRMGSATAAAVVQRGLDLADGTHAHLDAGLRARAAQIEPDTDRALAQ